MFGNGERTVFFPVRLVEGRSEGVLENPRIEPPAAFRRDGARKLRQQHGAMGADRTENIRVAHREVQGAVAPHREAADPARIAFCDGPIVVINVGNEFLDKKSS